MNFYRKGEISLKNKRIQTVWKAAALLLLMPMLFSCAVLDRFTSLIGYDTYDYMAEDVIGSVDKDSEVWLTLEGMLPMLTVSSAELPEFDGAAEAQSLCRDSLLNYMLDSRYSMYAGNAELISEVREKYPEYQLIAAIPKDDYESMMYRYFGGSSKINHGSTALFNYLDRAEAYVPVTSPIEGGVDFTMTSAMETEHSYRISFSASSGEGDRTLRYFALVIKRDDGTLYFRTLMRDE